MANRIPRVQSRLAEYDADALLLSFLPNIRWACGFTGSNGLLLVEEENAAFVTDGRYTSQARKEVEGATIVIAKDGLVSRLEEGGYLNSLRRVVFQADDVTVAKRDQLQKNCPDIDWVPKTSILTRLVGSKDEEEVQRIRRAQGITEAVFEHILNILKPGLTEREVAAEITYQHLKRGAEKMSFPPIVASGPNGALPHARPTDRVLRHGDLIVLDMGGVREGYASDMTRTVALGKPSDAARRGYDIVRDAQLRALDAARAGLTGKELDAYARDLIEEAGFGEQFSHGLGHGIGLEVHEWPRVSRTSEVELPVGACVTIEPGVYVPEEEYGVRIEDIIVLKKGRCVNLTNVEKELVIL